MANIIQTSQQKMQDNKSGKKGMQDLIKSMEGEIRKALPSVITPERFTRMVLSAMSVNPKLAACTPKSFLGAMMTAAQLGVEPNTALGQAYMIPYLNHGTLECQFQLGYKGLIDLAYRSGKVSVIQAHVVCEKDVFEYSLGLEPKLVHKPAMGERGQVIAYYAMFQTKDGGYGFEVMSRDDIERHARRYSKAYDKGPWKTNFDEMAKKTVLKAALKYAPLSTDISRELAQDGSVKSEISDDMYTVPSEVIDDYVTVDDETGEVVEAEEVMSK